MKPFWTSNWWQQTNKQTKKTQQTQQTQQTTTNNNKQQLLQHTVTYCTVWKCWKETCFSSVVEQQHYSIYCASRIASPLPAPHAWVWQGHHQDMTKQESAESKNKKNTESADKPAPTNLELWILVSPTFQKSMFGWSDGFSKALHAIQVKTQPFHLARCHRQGNGDATQGIVLVFNAWLSHSTLSLTIIKPDL